MAQVTVDISEYDALRAQNEERKQKIKDQEKEIGDLKAGTRALFKSYVKIPNFSMNSMIQFLQERGGRMGYCMRSDIGDVSLVANEYLSYLVSRNDLRLHTESQQYVNFDDIVCSVRGDITREVNTELDEKRRELDNLSKKYNQTEEEIYNKCKELFDSDIDSINKVHKSTVEEFKEVVSDYKKKVGKLKDKTQELTDSIESYRRLNWFQRIFKSI